ncbi:MAG: hypothetical protein MK160_01195 [Rhodobacteraceae bacterium]|nr:hypothetical protein [Paracoccaceae bacterium]
MIRLSRRTFAAGSIAFIVIGIMHTYVHFAELAGDDLRARFLGIGPVALQGSAVSAWDLFQGISLLMGFFSTALGLILLAILIQVPRTHVPHWFISLTTCVILLAISIVGALFLSNFQLIGGLIGILCFGLPAYSFGRF